MNDKQEEAEEKGACCKSSEKKSSVKQGIVYGLIPHIGCISFIAASVLGVTVAVNFFKPLLMNPWFFHILVLLSVTFATISSAIYLRKNGFLSMHGIRSKWKYLSTMYGSTIGVNLLLFMIIFPLMANVSVSSPTGAFTGDVGLSSIKLQVDIPCSGHAPLITDELKTITGIASVQFSYPNIFDVKYDPSKTTKQEIMSLEVFKTYKATIVNETIQQNSQLPTNQLGSTGSCCGSSGGCGQNSGCGCGNK
jgi:copper chaperone CopZ